MPVSRSNAARPNPLSPGHPEETRQPTGPTGGPDDADAEDERRHEHARRVVSAMLRAGDAGARRAREGARAEAEEIVRRARVRAAEIEAVALATLQSARESTARLLRGEGPEDPMEPRATSPSGPDRTPIVRSALFPAPPVEPVPPDPAEVAAELWGSGGSPARSAQSGSGPGSAAR